MILIIRCGQSKLKNEVESIVYKLKNSLGNSKLPRLFHFTLSATFYVLCLANTQAISICRVQLKLKTYLDKALIEKDARSIDEINNGI
jgi:hypothetical protein